MNKEKLDHLISTYRTKLKEAYMANPDRYVWPIDQFDSVVARTRIGVEGGLFNKDGPAMKATLKELGIKSTYTAVREYLK